MTRTMSIAATLLITAMPALAWDDERAQRMVDRMVSSGGAGTAASRMTSRLDDDKMERARQAAIASGASTAPISRARIEAAIGVANSRTSREAAPWSKILDFIAPKPTDSSSGAGGSTGSRAAIFDRIDEAKSAILDFDRQSTNPVIAGAQVRAAGRRLDRAQEDLELHALGLERNLRSGTTSNPHEWGSNSSGRDDFGDPGGAPNFGDCNCGR